MASSFDDEVTAIQRRVADMDGMSDITSNKPGIYSITNTADGKVYVGLAISICRRITSHRWALRRNKHKNPLLQASWNEHGEAAFQFAVLEFCPLRKRGGRHVRKDVQNLDRRERFWINTFGSTKTSRGFNIDGLTPGFFSFFLLDELMKSKGQNLEEFLKSKDQYRLDKQTRQDLEKLVALRLPQCTPKYVANLYGVSVGKVIRWIKRGDLLATKNARRWRISRQAIEDFERSGTVQVKPAAEKISVQMATCRRLDDLMRLNVAELMDLNAFHGIGANNRRARIMMDLKRIHPA